MSAKRKPKVEWIDVVSPPIVEEIKNMSVFVIEDGIEIPKTNRGSRPRGELKYPFRHLEVGQSFFVESIVPNLQLSRQLSSSAAQVRKQDGKKFAQRKITDDGATGYRVWRTV